MSSILKALRRLEEERARQSSAAPEIAASLLRNGTRRRSSLPWLWVALFTGVAAMVMISLFLWLWRPVPMVISQRPPIEPTAVPLAGTGAAVRGGVLIIEEVIDQRRPVLSPVRPSPVSTPVSPLTTQSAAPERKLASEKSLSAAVSIEERQIPLVTAIAWQDDSSARMAVVDGLPVMTGETIGTARVQDIRRDSILFIEEGVQFVVRLDSQ